MDLTNITLTYSNVKLINNYINNNNLNELIITIPNTKNISCDLLSLLDDKIKIRVQSGITPNFIKNNMLKRLSMNDNASKIYTTNYYRKVTYTKQELIDIIKTMEEIEKNIDPNWNDITKFMYIYTHLGKKIKYEKNIDDSNLKGLLTNKSVCMGYSIILKEMLNRSDIDSELICGYHNTKEHPHMWNLVVLDGNKYQVDLTWDAKHYQSNTDANKYLLCDTDTFNKNHTPVGNNIYYLDDISEFDADTLKGIYQYFNNNITNVNLYKNKTKVKIISAS